MFPTSALVCLSVPEYHILMAGGGVAHNTAVVHIFLWLFYLGVMGHYYDINTFLAESVGLCP